MTQFIRPIEKLILQKGFSSQNVSYDQKNSNQGCMRDSLIYTTKTTYGSYEKLAQIGVIQCFGEGSIKRKSGVKQAHIYINSAVHFPTN